MLGFLETDSFALIAYLIAGQRNDEYYSFKDTLALPATNTLLQYMYKLIKELKLLGIGSLDTDKESGIIGSLTSFINLPKVMWPSLTNELGEFDWLQISRSFPHVANLGTVIEMVTCSSSSIERVFSVANKLVTPDVDIAMVPVFPDTFNWDFFYNHYDYAKGIDDLTNTIRSKTG